MLATLEGRVVDQSAMPNGLYVAVSNNQPTQVAVGALQVALVALDQGAKNALIQVLLVDTEPWVFLTDRDVPLPAIDPTAFVPLKALASHLYKSTGVLADVKAACGESIDDHYARFRVRVAPGNGNVCCVCGTETLAQMQAGVDSNEQWRGPYDHLLAKDKYPLYGVHAKNLVPICQTCNSKAKLAKDLLLKDGNRRLSFSPWTEYATTVEVRVSIDDTDAFFPRVVVNLASDDPDRHEKLGTWDDVYKIKARIEGEFSDLREKMSEDISASNEVNFLTSLEERTVTNAAAGRSTAFCYWRSRVYCAVRNMPATSREVLRVTILESMPDTAELDRLFFG
ncbi:hypothetical protein PO883_33525 [Massilia sp. DJPM01]|uniref:hypothetical protein n=1 Tax=Massilia sp. DJPM01 TaxID=3024404 RepID=UPI00259E0D55|nr:hypothetical protein [Massilia sp. DJPM01]MDM5182095.1 hypothetical protein [Massilia sp. DJPM01]